MSTPASRRQFLRAARGLSAAAAVQGFSAPLAMSLGGLAAMAAQSSQAASLGSPYRALVCLFMAGGNDAHNWVVPTDAEGYAGYSAVRRELAWPADRLLPLSVSGQAAGRSFGMPTELQPLRDLVEAGRAALVANVGPLQRPLTKAEFLAGIDLPSKLFSHNDQQSAWQSLSPEGARSGWGGRMGDVLMAANAYPLFTAVSAAGNAVFLSGSSVAQYQVGLEGPVPVQALRAGGWAASASPQAAAVLRRSLGETGDTPFQREYTRVTERSLAAEAVLSTALQQTNVPALPTGLAQDNLARQLRIVARMIAAGQGLGMRRQVFMVTTSGFDTHANQMRDHPALMSRVAQSTAYFMAALDALGLANNVTLFTASDFGRTLVSNGSGSDHGWGGHHLVAGGSVRGRMMVGRFPVTALGTADDVGSGRLLPGIGVTELAASLGGWMGLSSAELATVLPSLPAFGNRLPPLLNPLG